MTDPQAGPQYEGYGQRLPRPSQCTDEGLGPKKTMVVMVVVVGCFAILWPKIFYPMLVSNASGGVRPGPDDRGCCDVISELDVDTIKIMSELCSTMIDRGKDAGKKRTAKEIVVQCRKEVLETCGIDISAALQDRISLGHSMKQILEEVRSLNGTMCLKYHFGVSPWSLGVGHRVNVELDQTNSIRQERPAYIRPGAMHPAFRERGRAIPEAGDVPVPRRSAVPPKIVEGRPGPIAGVRPAMGGQGIVHPKQPSYGVIGVLMPVYTVIIVIFFTYTCIRLTTKKKVENYEGAPLYPPCDTDDDFRKEVFDTSRPYFDRPHRDTSKIVVNAVAALLEEVSTEIEAHKNKTPIDHSSSSSTSEQERLKQNGSLPNDDDQGSVTVMGMETTASAESGKKWSRPDSPVLPHAQPVAREPSPPQQIFLETPLPPQSQILVADLEEQKDSEDDSPVVLAGKMTLSVISLDSEDSSSSAKKEDGERRTSSSNVSEEFEKINTSDLEEQIERIIDQGKAVAEDVELGPTQSESSEPPELKENLVMEEIKNQLKLEGDLLDVLRRSEQEVGGLVSRDGRTEDSTIFQDSRKEQEPHGAELEALLEIQQQLDQALFHEASQRTGEIDQTIIKEAAFPLEKVVKEELFTPLKVADSVQDFLRNEQKELDEQLPIGTVASEEVSPTSDFEMVAAVPREDPSAMELSAATGTIGASPDEQNQDLTISQGDRKEEEPHGAQLEALLEVQHQLRKALLHEAPQRTVEADKTLLKETSETVVKEELFTQPDSVQNLRKGDEMQTGALVSPTTSDFEMVAAVPREDQSAKELSAATGSIGASPDEQNQDLTISQGDRKEEEPHGAQLEALLEVQHQLRKALFHEAPQRTVEADKTLLKETSETVVKEELFTQPDSVQDLRKGEEMQTGALVSPTTSDFEMVAAVPREDQSAKELEALLDIQKQLEKALFEDETHIKEIIPQKSASLSVTTEVLQQQRSPLEEASNLQLLSEGAADTQQFTVKEEQNHATKDVSAQQMLISQPLTLDSLALQEETAASNSEQPKLQPLDALKLPEEVFQPVVLREDQGPSSAEAKLTPEAENRIESPSRPYRLGEPSIEEILREELRGERETGRETSPADLLLAGLAIRTVEVPDEEELDRDLDVVEQVIEEIHYETDEEDFDEDESRVNGVGTSEGSSRNGAEPSETAAENDISENELVNEDEEEDEEIEEIVEYVDNTDEEGEEIIEVNGNNEPSRRINNENGPR